MLAHVPSFGRNPRGSPDFLAYPLPQACMHVLGTRVQRCLGVARSASSPKAAQALGCSLTPGLRISFGRVTCMARAASVPWLWALGFLLLCGVCVWVRLAVGCGFCEPPQSWLGSWVGVFGHGLWRCPSTVGCLWCSWLDFGFGLLLGRVWFRGRPACPPPLPVPACGVGVCVGPGSRLCPALLCWVVWVCFLRFCFFFCFSFFFFPGFVVPVPPSPSFRAGLVVLPFFFFFPFRCPFSPWAAVTGLVLPVLGGWSACTSVGVLSSVPSGGGFGRLWWCWRAVWRLWAVFVPFHPPPSFFLGGGGGGGGGGGLACSSLCLPWAGARTGLHSVLSSGLLSSVALCVAAFRPHGSGGPCTLWARSPFLPGLVLALPAGRLRQAGACGYGLGGWGCSCPFPSAVPAVFFWVVRHRCRLARCGPVCGLRCWCVACWCGAFQGVRWLASVCPSG